MLEFMDASVVTLVTTVDGVNEEDMAPLEPSFDDEGDERLEDMALSPLLGEHEDEVVDAAPEVEAVTA